jgi:hypothetical protein
MTAPPATYLRRQTRSGPAVWVYGVALAAADTIRRVVLWQLDATEAARTISFVAIACGVIASVDGFGALRRHRPTRRRPSPRRIGADAGERDHP